MNVGKPITVLLAEDHVIVRQGLRALLEMDRNYAIAGEARTGREAVALARRLQPDVIVMDIAMPVLNGFDATREILAAKPTARVIVLSAHSDDMYIAQMLQAGAAGFVEKQSAAEILAQAIREVAAGRMFFSPAIERRLHAAQKMRRGWDEFPKANARPLTARENEVLRLVAEGSSNKQIAATLGISIKTVEKHRQHLMDKLNIHDTATLTRYAISAGVIETGVELTLT